MNELTVDKFAELSAINVSKHVEKKNGLTYLSWAWAWSYFKKTYPDAHYEVVKSPEGSPYFESRAGVMVYTKVTAGGIEHEMWLPVMDGANKAMKREAYTYRTKYGERTCDAFDMFDVNKTIMRCLTKNLAMFGLGLYIYAGEDLPEVVEKESSKSITKPEVKESSKSIARAVYDEQPIEVQNELRDIAMEVISAMSPSQGLEIIDSYDLDADKMTALYSFFDSKMRNALSEARKERDEI